MKDEIIRGTCPVHPNWSADIYALCDILRIRELDSVKHRACPICILAARPGLEARP